MARLRTLYSLRKFILTVTWLHIPYTLTGSLAPLLRAPPAPSLPLVVQSPKGRASAGGAPGQPGDLRRGAGRKQVRRRVPPPLPTATTPKRTERVYGRSTPWVHSYGRGRKQQLRHGVGVQPTPASHWGGVGVDGGDKGCLFAVPWERVCGGKGGLRSADTLHATPLTGFIKTR